MPTLQFKGKNIIWNHHLAVPFHTLDEVPELHYQPEKANGNMIIEGDNLVALKALLPQFAGRIKCVCIDPPYNTGNDNGQGNGWIYNDNVNSPLIKDWIGKEVGIEDLTKHDKWLCMMTPRIKLLRDLLSDEGVIFVFCDDNEQYSLRSILNEIFGEDNFLANIIWQHSIQAKGYSDKFSLHHNHLLMYQKTEQFGLKTLERTEEHNKNYSNPDNDPNGDWRTGDIRNSLYRPNLIYDIKTPSGKTISPPSNGWRFSKETMNKKIESKQIIFNQDETRLIFKIYLKDVKGRVPETIWFGKDVGTTRDGKNVLKELFDGVAPFETPKPIEIIKRIIEISTEEYDYVLDSYSGSGTTMHALFDYNKTNEKFLSCIMIQMPENSEAEPDKNICKDITRERVKRAIDKYGYDSGFKYYRLGIPLDAETMLAGQLPTYNQFAKYVYYLCTGENLEDENKIKEKDFFVGEYGKQAIYLVYKQDYETLTRLALNLTLAEKIKEQQPGKKRIVYAPSCFLDEEYLTDNQIEYVGIPYNLFQRNQ